MIIFLVVFYVVHWATGFFSFLSSSFSSSSSSSSLLLLLLLPPPPRHYRSFVRDLFFFLSFSNHRGRRMMDIKSPSDSPNPYGSPASEPTSRLVRRQCGGQLTAFPVVFTVDSRHGFHLFLKETPGRDIDASFLYCPQYRFFFCSSFVDVKMFSVETGQPVRTLSGHTKPVTSAHINPKNPLQVWWPFPPVTLEFNSPRTRWWIISLWRVY